MTEIELKFQVPGGQVAAVQRAVATASARRVRLQARYFDTPDGALAAAGLALRLRREGTGRGAVWVQTLKGAGDGMLTRSEHNVVVPGASVELDVARHAGTPAGDALFRALPDATALVERYATDVVRTLRAVRCAGAVVEVAFDRGRIRAGRAGLALCEVEFELQRGSPRALIDLAGRWAARHGLWLDVRTKAERGALLSRGQSVSPPVRAGASPLRPRMSHGEALRAMLADSLGQALPNAGAIAAGLGQPDHLHQLRVALRRARAALALFGDDAAAAGSAPGADLAQRIAGLFSRLGAARDTDVLSTSLWPALRAAGAPPIAMPPPAGAADIAADLRDRATTQLWLDWMAGALPVEPAAQAAASVPAAETPPFRPLARKRLRKLRRRAVEEARQFALLDDPSRHALRRRLKRLRYGIEFVAPLFPAKAVERELAALRHAQDALGDFNDLCVAEATFQQALASDARAWFALGWLSSRREAVSASGARWLKAWADTPPFWKKG